VTTTARSIDATLRRLRRKAASSAEIAEALDLLAADDDLDDPFAAADAAAAGAARLINGRRQHRRRAELRGRALTTAEVVALVDSMSDRRAVDRRRQRGRLLGIKVGRTILHPVWQFDRDRGEARAGLDRVLAALGEVTPDSRAADALMTVPRPDLGGATIAGVFERGDLEAAVRLIRLAGDQS
jgi:hypothetical protein